MPSSAPTPAWPERYAAAAVRGRFWLLGLVIILTGLALTQIPRIIIRNDPDSLLPLRNPHVQTNNYVEQTFGMGNLVVIGLAVREGDIYQPWFINAVRQLHQHLAALPGARPENFISIAAKKVRYIRGTEDGLDIRRLLPREGLPDDPVAAEAALTVLRTGLETNPILRPMLLSEDRKATFIIADFDSSIKNQYYTWVLAFQALLAQTRADDRLQVYVSGEPYFLASMLVNLAQHWHWFLLSLLLVLAVLYAESRSWRLALLPVLTVSISILWTLGLMGLTRFELTTMMVLTPVLIFAIGIGHAVQIMRRYGDELHTQPPQLAAQRAIRHTLFPASMAILTDVVGFFSLAWVDISFYRDYAYFGMFGMFSLLLTTTTLLPLLLVMWVSHKPLPADHTVRTWEARLGQGVLKLLTGPWKWLPVGLSLGLVGVSALFIPRLELGIHYPEAAFKPSSPLIQDLNQLNRMMPGVVSFNIPLLGREPGAFKRLEVLQAIDELESFLHQDPNVGYTVSFSQYLRLLNQSLHNNDPAYWRLPDDPELVEQYIFTYAMGADSGDFSSVVDYDYGNAQIIGYIKTLDPKSVHATLERIRTYIKLHRDDPQFRPVALGLPQLRPEVGIGGFAGTTEASREISAENWLLNPLLTALLVGGVITWMFRSLLMATLIMLMVSITLITQYGLGGYFSSVGNWGGNLHFGNLVTLSIAMGLGVDYCIYLAARFRVEYERSEDLNEALKQTLSTTGSGVVLAVVVLLLSLLPLFLTDLANIWGLAMYTSVAILTSVFTALFLLPLLLRWAVDLPFTLGYASNFLNLQVSERTLALRKEKEEVSNALRLLKETQERLVQSEKMASLGGLVAGVAHEINTPLGNAVTTASFLHERILTLTGSFNAGKMKRSELEEFLKLAEEGFQMLQHNMQRAANLVHSFKQVAVDQSSEAQREFGLKPYLEEILLSLSPLLRKNQVEVMLTCPEPLYITSYPGVFAQILTNLISNAVLHGFEDQPPPRQIQIEVGFEEDWVRNVYPVPQPGTGPRELVRRRPEERLVLQVSDNGKGIADAHLKRIYEPFFTTRRGTGGSGLGLHITYNLVTRTLGGEIACRSQPGLGTHFTLKIPLPLHAVRHDA